MPNNYTSIVIETTSSPVSQNGGRILKNAKIFFALATPLAAMSLGGSNTTPPVQINETPNSSQAISSERISFSTMFTATKPRAINTIKTRKTFLLIKKGFGKPIVNHDSFVTTWG